MRRVPGPLSLQEDIATSSPPVPMWIEIDGRAIILHVSVRIDNNYYYVILRFATDNIRGVRIKVTLQDRYFVAELKMSGRHD